MRQMLRNLGAVPLALAAILALVRLMQALISARTEQTEQALPVPSVVYWIKTAATDTEVWLGRRCQHMQPGESPSEWCA